MSVEALVRTLNETWAADKQWAALQKGYLWSEALREELAQETLANLAILASIECTAFYADSPPCADDESVDDEEDESEEEIEDDGNVNPSLRIGNLSTASDRAKLLATLRTTFGAAGGGADTVKDVNLPMDRTTGNIRGFAFIEFHEPRSASRALRSLFGKLKLGGRDIRVEYAASKRKSTDEMAATYGTNRF